MDSNPWSDYNQHYGRLAHSTAIPGAVNRYDLLEQQGLGSLPSTLPSHTGLPSARPLANLPSMAYSHPLHNMTQFLETVSPLQPTFTGPTSYKPQVATSQTGLHVAMDPLMTPRLPPASPITMTRYISPPIPSPERKQVSTSSLHSKDVSSYSSRLTSQRLPASSPVSDPKGWNLSNFVQSESSPFGSIENYGMSPYSAPSLSTSPPKSSISLQRSPYQQESTYTRCHPSPRSPHGTGSSYRAQSQSPSPHMTEAALHREQVSHHSHSHSRYDALPQSQPDDLRRTHRSDDDIHQDTLHAGHAEDVRTLMDLSSKKSHGHQQQLEKDIFMGHSHYGTSSAMPRSARMHEEALARPTQPGSSMFQAYDVHGQTSDPSLIKPTQSMFDQYSNPAMHVQSRTAYEPPPSAMPQDFSSSRLSNEMNYDPVSPVGPPTEAQSENFSTISLQDLHSLDSHSDNPLQDKPQSYPHGHQQREVLQPQIPSTKEKVKKGKEESKRRRSKSKSSKVHVRDVSQEHMQASEIPSQIQYGSYQSQQMIPPNHEVQQTAQMTHFAEERSLHTPEIQSRAQQMQYEAIQHQQNLHSSQQMSPSFRKTHHQSESQAPLQSPLKHSNQTMHGQVDTWRGNSNQTIHGHVDTQRETSNQTIHGHVDTQRETSNRTIHGHVDTQLENSTMAIQGHVDTHRVSQDEYNSMQMPYSVASPISDVPQQEPPLQHTTNISHETLNPKKRFRNYSQQSSNEEPLVTDLRDDISVQDEIPLTTLDEGNPVSFQGSHPDSTPLKSIEASVIHSNPLPVQALADSTTIPKPRKTRGRKKKQQAVVKAVEQPVPSKQLGNSFQASMPEDTGSTSQILDDNPWTQKTLTEINSPVADVKSDPKSMTEGVDAGEDLSIGLESMPPEACDMLKGSADMGIEMVAGDSSLDQKAADVSAVDSGYFPDKSLSDSSFVGMDSQNSDNVYNTFDSCDDIHDNLSNQLIDAAIEAGKQRKKTCHKRKDPPPKKEKVPKVVTAELEFDEDFQHLASPPKKPAANTPEKENLTKLAGGSKAFLGSFLNFIGGKKGETLTSVVQTPVKRPPLPKYVPEPPRPKPKIPEMPPEKKLDSPDSTQPTSETPETSNKARAENVWDSVGKKSKGRQKSKSVVRRGGKQKLKKARSFDDDGIGSGSDGEKPAEEEPEPVPVRRQSARRASMAKKPKYVDSDSDEELKQALDDEEVTYTSEEEVAYDSDEDPAWTPFAAERQQSSGDGFQPRVRKISKAAMGRRPSYGGVKRKRSNVAEIYEPDRSSNPPAEVLEKTEDGEDLAEDEPEESDDNTTTEDATPSVPVQTQENYAKGSFLIERRDLTNYENYPIWKVSEGKMLQKFELFIEGGKVLHRSTFTYSSWTPMMQRQFQPVKAEVLSHDKRREVVSIREEDRPRPPSDGSLERQYEDNPLVENFNVYIQILLSQALEPGFLKAIYHSDDDFYLGNLTKVDELIDHRVQEIERKVKWSKGFKEAVRNRPHVRELDRPNLKQTCQACTNVNQTAIKSVHLFGDMYDSVDLVDVPQSATTQSQEFLIGKTAVKYLSTYHSLVHYKYNLYKRCTAKVKVVRESEGTKDNSDVLDSCLHHRAWVLKLFEDLKELLEKP